MSPTLSWTSLSRESGRDEREHAGGRRPGRPGRGSGRGPPGPAGRAHRHVRHRDNRRHLGLWRAAGAPAGPAVHRPALRVLLRRDSRPAGRGPGARRRHVRRGGAAGGRGSGRTHPARAARAPGDGRQADARRPFARVRDVPGGQRGPLPLGHRARSARRLPAAVHHAQPQGPARGDRARQRPADSLAGERVPDLRLARAGDLGLLRPHLRGPSRAHPDRDARRLEGPPAAQGLPAGRNPGRVPRRDDSAARGSEVVFMTAEAEGGVYHVSGQDWDEVITAATEVAEERLVVNMGPQHPSTHGVLRLILTLDGETVTELRPVIGYLHTGIEKNMEFRTWTQGVTFCTRMDYLAPLFNEAAYCLAAEKLLRIEAEIPDRASVIRVLLMELNRISSHLMAVATFGMELGATT